MQKDERRPKGQVLKPGFTSKLFKELLEGHRDFPNVHKLCPLFDCQKEYATLNEMKLN